MILIYISRNIFHQSACTVIHECFATGNPWPPVVSKERDISNSLVNVLIDEAKKEFRHTKFEQMMALKSKLGSDLSDSDKITSQMESLTSKANVVVSDDKRDL